MVCSSSLTPAARGKAEPNDKTMCDVWWPVVESLKHSSEQNLSLKEALNQAQIVAEKLTASVPMVCSSSLTPAATASWQ